MDFDYKLIYSKRKTVSLTIKRDGCLTVRAPKRVSKKEIDNILREKEEWIKEHLSTVSKIAKHEYIDGESFLFLGERFPLRILDDYRSKLIFDNGVFQLSRFKTNQAKQLFVDWYAAQAAKIIFERAKYFAGLMSVKYKRISITSAQTRWGSCSSGSTINFTWKLVLAPPHIIDSVVVHELAHLIHHNHSKNFWQKVKEHYPNYAAAKKWLKEHGHLLQI